MLLEVPILSHDRSNRDPSTGHSTSHPSQEALQDYALGRIADAESEDVAKHLEQCSSCRESVEQTPGDRFVVLLSKFDDRGTAELPLRLQRRV